MIPTPILSDHNILEIIFDLPFGFPINNIISLWSQQHNLYQTVIEKVSNNKPFVKSNLLNEVKIAFIIARTEIM